MSEPRHPQERGKNQYEIMIANIAKKVSEHAIVVGSINQVYKNATQKFEEPVPSDVTAVFEEGVKSIVKQIVESSRFEINIQDQNFKKELAQHVNELILKGLYDEGSFLTTVIDKVRQKLNIVPTYEGQFKYDFGKFVNAAAQVTVVTQFNVNPDILRMSDDKQKDKKTIH